MSRERGSQSVRRACIAITVGLLLTMAGTARAETYTYEHGGSPLFSIEFPAGWALDLDFEQEAREAGTYEEGEELELRVVEARPGDGRHLWVGLWAVPGTSTLDEATDYFASLRQELFTDLEITAGIDAEVDGIPVRTFSGKARREGATVELRMALFEPRSGVIAATLYVGEPDAWELHADELEAMARTIEPAG